MPAQNSLWGKSLRASMKPEKHLNFPQEEFVYLTTSLSMTSMNMEKPDQIIRYSKTHEEDKENLKTPFSCFALKRA